MARKKLDPIQKKRRRRRRLGISLVIVLLLLLVPPYFVGKEVEKGLRKAEARLANHPTISFAVQSLERGWFSTKSVIDLSMVRHGKGGEKTPVFSTTLHNKTNHGLFYLSPLVQRQQARLPGAVLSELSDQTNLEVAMSSGFRLKYLLSSVEDSGVVRAMGAEHEIHSKNVTANVETSKDNSRTIVDANVESLKLGSKDAPIAEASNLVVQADVLKPSLVDGQFEPAMVNMHLNVDKLSFAALIAGATVKNLSLDVQAIKDGEDFVRDIKLTIDLLKAHSRNDKGMVEHIYCNPGCSDIELSIRIDGLDAQAAYMIDTQLKNIEADLKDLGSSTQLAQIFAAEPTLDIRGIKLSAFNGDLDIRGKLKLLKVDTPAIALDQLPESFDGDIKLRFDASLIKGYEVKKAGFFSNKRKIRQEVDETMEEYVEAGWLLHDKKNDRYSSHILFKDKMMQLNP